MSLFASLHEIIDYSKTTDAQLQKENQVCASWHTFVLPPMNYSCFKKKKRGGAVKKKILHIAQLFVGNPVESLGEAKIALTLEFWFNQLCLI